MQTNVENRGYVLLFTGKDWDEGLTNEQLQEVLDRYTAWTNSLNASGKVTGGQVLGRQEKPLAVRSPRRGWPLRRIERSGGGFIHVLVDSFEEAWKSPNLSRSGSRWNNRDSACAVRVSGLEARGGPIEHRAAAFAACQSIRNFSL
jgi:hypothetical protein